MTLPELDEQVRDDYSSLLVVVDVANIRPRSEEQKHRFLRKFSKSWKFRSDEGPTSFEFIDQCLFDLERVAPGAVIVQFADFSLRDSLERDDQKEFLRRQDLADYDRNKIFVVGAAEADEPILITSLHIGGVVISRDTFKKYSHLLEDRSRLFEHDYTPDTSSFTFARRDNLNLSEWWSHANGFVTGEWLSSNEYLDVEFALRTRVKEVAWPWISIPLTHKPELPEGIYEFVEQKQKLRRRITGPKRSARISQDSEEILPKDPIPSESKGVGSHGSAIGVSASSVKKKRPSRYLLADDFAGMRKFDGQYVTVVGRLVGEETAKLQWLPGTEAIVLEGLSMTSLDVGNAFVECSGGLTIRGDSICLTVTDKNAVSRTTYSNIRNNLKDQSRAVGTSSRDAKPWKVLNLAESVLALLHLRRQVGGESEFAFKLNDGDSNRPMKTVGSDHQIQEAVVPDTSSDNQTYLVKNSPSADSGMMEEDHVGTYAEREVNSVNQMSRPMHTEFFSVELERDSPTGIENTSTQNENVNFALESQANQRVRSNRKSFEKPRLVSLRLFWIVTSLVLVVFTLSVILF